MKKWLGISVVSVCVAVSSLSAQAANPKPEDAVHYRQGVMNAIGWHFKPLGAMVKGEKPFDKDEFLRRAIYLEALAKMPMEGFAPGTDFTADTKAKPEIWKEPAKFKSGMEKLEVQTAKLVEAAKTGKLDVIKPQFAETAKTCKACHDNFKEK